MADIADVLNTLVTTITGILYPAAYPITAQPPVSAAGPIVRVQRGFPFPNDLDADMQAGGVVRVAVNESQGSFGKNTTRFPQAWQTQSIVSSTLLLNVSNNMVVVQGTPAVGQVAIVGVTKKAYAYAVLSTDTVVSIAAALLSQIVLDWPGSTVVSNVLTVAGVTRLLATVSTPGVSVQPTRQQEVMIQLRVFGPNYALRDQVAGYVDAGLSSIVRFTLPDTTIATLKWDGTSYEEKSQKAWVFIRVLRYRVEYSTIQTRTDQTIGAYEAYAQAPSYPPQSPSTLRQLSPTTAMLSMGPNPAAAKPLIGAIRFDGWYSLSTGDSVSSGLAADLSPAQFNYRLPWFATVTNGQAAWPAATQSTIDAELHLASAAGLSFWAFDSYRPTDVESVALGFYLTSAFRSKLQFCMIGQVSNWNIDNTSSWQAPYSTAFQRDVTMFLQAGYVTVLDHRPLYFMLGAETNTIMTAAVSYLRAQSIAQGTGNPYVVGLASSGLAAYDNVSAWAEAVGCDAAGTYSNPPILPGEQPYQQLVIGAEGDWYARARRGFPMVPTAMTDYDPRPVSSGSAYFDEAKPWEISNQIQDLVQFLLQNPVACPINAGLIYAWNELSEGGRCLIPTYLPNNPVGDLSRTLALSQVLGG